MTSLRIHGLAAALILLATGAEAQSLTPEDMLPFTAACVADPDVALATQFAPEGPEGGAQRLCGCMASELSYQISDTDLALYTRFLEGRASDDELMAYGTFEDLNAFVGETRDTCLVTEGFADGYDPGADMGGD